MTETNGFTIIAHRGFSEKLPENTFPAFDLAIGLGFHNLELDVQLTKDKIPVIIHDSNLLRTTGVNDLVSERKYNQIKFLEAVNEFSVAGEEWRVNVSVRGSVRERIRGAFMHACAFCLPVGRRH